MTRPSGDARGCSDRGGMRRSPRGARGGMLGSGRDARLGDGCWARPERCRCSLPPNRPDCYGTLVFMAPAPSPGSAFPQFKAHLLVTSSQRSSAGGAGVEMLIAKSFHKKQLLRGSEADFLNVLSRSSKFASSWDLKASPAILFWASKQSCPVLSLVCIRSPRSSPTLLGIFLNCRPCSQAGQNFIHEKETSQCSACEPPTIAGYRE